jgi:hypothetical protein
MSVNKRMFLPIALQASSDEAIKDRVKGMTEEEKDFIEEEMRKAFEMELDKDFEQDIKGTGMTSPRGFLSYKK